MLEVRVLCLWKSFRTRSTAMYFLYGFIMTGTRTSTTVSFLETNTHF